MSTGLLQRLGRSEVEAVLAHEVTHVANGDIVTLTLMQGVVNAFVIFLARVIGDVVDSALLRGESGRGMGCFATVIVAEIALGLVASMIVAWFSRRQEFHADAGGALRALQGAREPAGLPDPLAAFGITGEVPAGIKRLFLSHPPIEERIAAMQT